MTTHSDLLRQCDDPQWAVTRIERLEAQVIDRGNMLEDVINELNLSEIAIEQHGPMGTPPAELVKLVLAEKDLKIVALNAGLVALQEST